MSFYCRFKSLNDQKGIFCFFSFNTCFGAVFVDGGGGVRLRAELGNELVGFVHILVDQRRIARVESLQY